MALVIYGELRPVSGGYRYDLELVRGLERAGDTVRIVSMPPKPWRACLADNIDPRWADTIESLRADVILEDELNHPSLIGTNGRLRAKRRHPPLVSIVHHLRSNEDHPSAALALYRQVERRYLATVDGCVYNSRTTRRETERLAGSRAWVVAHPAGDRLGAGLDAAAVISRSREPGPLRLLFLGNVIRRKGLDHLIRALAHLPAGSWTLTVAGDEGAEPRTASRARLMARRLGVAGAVRFVGRLEDADLREALATHQVLAVPSRYEGFGIAYLEGMGFGLPALAGIEGGAAEIVEDGVNGYLVRPGDARELASRLRRLSEDRDHLAALSLAALDRYRLHPGWTAMAETVRAFLLRLVEAA